jgi:FkbM family methyltransferase
MLKQKFNKIYNKNISSEEKLNFLHENIKFDGNIKTKEYPEQLLSITYIKPTDIVLELGGNIGRNSCVISCILNDDKNLVTVECSNDYLPKLYKNRNNNNFNFYVEEAAISKQKLIQQNMITKPSEILEEGFSWIKTIHWKQFKNKYNKNFNVLVCDCEGALYYILRDEPTFLDNIERIILENDFLNDKQEKYTFNFIKEKGFKVIYEHGIKDWKPFTAKNPISKKNFYVVFSK